MEASLLRIAQVSPALHARGWFFVRWQRRAWRRPSVTSWR